MADNCPYEIYSRCRQEGHVSKECSELGHHFTLPSMPSNPKEFQAAKEHLLLGAAKNDELDLWVAHISGNQEVSADLGTNAQEAEASGVNEDNDEGDLSDPRNAGNQDVIADVGTNDQQAEASGVNEDEDEGDLFDPGNAGNQQVNVDVGIESQKAEADGTNGDNEEADPWGLAVDLRINGQEVGAGGVIEDNTTGSSQVSQPADASLLAGKQQWEQEFARTEASWDS